MRRIGWVAAGFVLIAAAGCSSSDGSASRSTTTRPPAEATTTRPGQVVAASTTLAEGAGVDEAREALARLKAELAYPADVLECVAADAAGDADLSAALSDEGGGKALAAVRAAAAACAVELHSAPRFAEDLQRGSGGLLSNEQVACAVREYGDLTPAQIEAASGAVINPEPAEPGDTRPVEEIYETCGIGRGDG